MLVLSRIPNGSEMRKIRCKYSKILNEKIEKLSHEKLKDVKY